MLTKMLTNGDPTDIVEIGVEKPIGQIKVNNTLYTVYRKLINCGAMPKATKKTVAHGITGSIKVLSCSGVTYHTNGVTALPLPYVYSNGAYMYCYVNDATTIAIADSSDWSATYTTTLVCLEYYKL